MQQRVRGVLHLLGDVGVPGAGESAFRRGSAGPGRSRGWRRVNLLIGSVSMGFLLSLLTLGVFITYRIMGRLDLTTDGSFGLGAAVAAALLARAPPARGDGGRGGRGVAGGRGDRAHLRRGRDRHPARRDSRDHRPLYRPALIMGGGDRSLVGAPTLPGIAEELWHALRLPDTVMLGNHVRGRARSRRSSCASPCSSCSASGSWPGSSAPTSASPCAPPGETPRRPRPRPRHRSDGDPRPRLGQRAGGARGGALRPVPGICQRHHGRGHDRHRAGVRVVGEGLLGDRRCAARSPGRCRHDRVPPAGGGGWPPACPATHSSSPPPRSSWSRWEPRAVARIPALARGALGAPVSAARARRRDPVLEATGCTTLLPWHAQRAGPSRAWT